MPNRILEGLASTFEFITQGLANIVDWLNPFSENFILKQLWDFLTFIIDYLNPFSENFILKGVLEFLGNILSFLNPFSENFFGYKIIELFSNLLQFLFIPSEDSINNLVNEVSSHFSFIETIKSLVNDVKDVVIDSEGMPSFTLHLNATKYTNEINIKILDLGWYAQFKQYGDAIITGFVYAFFVWKIFIKLPGIISGVSGDIQDVNDIDFSKFKNGGTKK